MKILSWNVNGLRANYKKGFLSWFKKSKTDLLCLQEVRATKDQLPAELIEPKGYLSFFNPAERLGYSGTAIYSKYKPLDIKKSIGYRRFDAEGRFLRLEFSDFILINLYIPHGGRRKENLGYKLGAYIYLLDYLKKIKEKNVVVVGDFNVAHKEIDLARPKENRNNIMFTTEERKKIDALISLGFKDSFRQFHQEGGYYTWWPFFSNARERNLGWRIDYAFISKSLAPKLKEAFILARVTGSDHCPIGIDIRF